MSAAAEARAAGGEDERLARAAWSRLVEPGDPVAHAVLHQLGGAGAVALLRGADLRRSGLVLAGERQERAVREGVARWRVRLPDLDVARDLRVVHGLGGRLLVPGDAEWPAGLDDLGPAAPACLWVIGGADVAVAAHRSLALVGSRASTGYGDRVAAQLAGAAAGRGTAVVSGGAYGVDGAAHRAALACGGTTLAVLAGGVDRFYPAGHEQLLRAVTGSGAVLSETPPGCAPTRWRFLARNRLIAALAGATVVVEAAWRSGALSTAARAAELNRPVGAVPGPVTSPSSAGCHRLVREGGAVLVTDEAEVFELLDDLGTTLALPAPQRAGPPADHDGLAPDDLRVLDALPLRSGRPAESVARTAGLTEARVLSALGLLSLRGLAERTGDAGLWRRAPLRG